MIPATSPALGRRTPRFGDQIHLHVDRMLSVARGVLKSEDLAWDAVQQTLIRLWQNDRLPGTAGEARGVLLANVFPESLGLLRAERRRRHHEECACRLCDERGGDSDPAATATARDLGKGVEAAIEALPADCREVVALRSGEGLEYGAIARRIGVPVGTVRSRLHRARRLLRAVLAELPPAEAGGVTP